MVRNVIYLATTLDIFYLIRVYCNYNNLNTIVYYLDCGDVFVGECICPNSSYRLH